jgi:NAD(P)-dependent dehydrogenase (short-subunit alcohol dehydrogenase family)
MCTPMFEAHRAKMSKDELAHLDRQLAETIPLGGKLGNPDRDLAPLMVFLASDGSRFITGQTLAVDGGILMTR